MFSIRKYLSSSKFQNKYGRNYFLLNDKAKQNIQIYNNNDYFTKNNNLQLKSNNNSCNLYPLCEICHKIERGDLLYRLIPKSFFCNKLCWNLCNENYCCKKNLR